MSNWTKQLLFELFYQDGGDVLQFVVDGSAPSNKCGDRFNLKQFFPRVITL